MTRVKRGTISLKRRRNVLSRAKGFRFGRGNKERQAKEALLHAGKYSFGHRRDKKRDYRATFQVQINAAVRPLGFSYSKFIGILKKKGVVLDRKVLSTIAAKHPESFARLVESVK